MKRLVTFLAALVFTFCLTTAPALAAPPSFFGMHVPGVEGGSYPTTTGVNSVRLWDSYTAWANVEQSPGVYSWGSLDKAVNTARSHGDSVFLVLGGTPSFYAQGSGVNIPTPYGSGFCADADLNAWSRYVTAVVQRYKGLINAYEPINEVDITMFYCGANTPHLVERAKIAYNVIQKYDPAAIVTTPSFVDRTTGSQFQVVDYLKAGGYRWAEAISYHPYGMPEYGPEQNANLIRSLYRKTSQWHLPIWSTEINYRLPFGDVKPEANRLTDWEQAAFMSRTYLLQNDAGAKRVYWYSWSEAQFLGVKFSSVTKSPAAKSLETVKWWMRGQVQPCVINRNGTYTCKVTYAGKDGVIKWNPNKVVYEKVPAGALTKRNMYGTLVPMSKAVGIAPVLYR